MALVSGPYMYVTSYAENCIVRMPWPICDRVHSRLRVRRPRGIVCHDGLLFVACYGNPMGHVAIVRLQDFTVVRKFRAFRPRGVAIWKDTVLVSEVNRHRVTCFGQDGRRLRAWKGMREPRDVCVHGDDMYVAESGGDRIVCVNLVSSERHVVSNASRPNGVATDGHTIVWTEWYTGTVTLLNLRTKVRLSFHVHTPGMVGFSSGQFTVCDTVANRVYLPG